MNIATTVLAVILAFVGLGAGLPKVALKGKVPEQLQAHMGLSAGLVRFIGLAEVAAAVGLIVGAFWWPPLGVAAAVGLAALLVGAVGFHVKAGDYGNAATRGNAVAPVVLVAVAVATAATLTGAF
jgi:DoxX-like family